MRCPDCAKMVSYGEPTVEWDDEPNLTIEVAQADEGVQEAKNADDDTPPLARVVVFDVSLRVDGSAKVTLPCAECSTDLAEATIEAEQFSIEHECEKADDPEDATATLEDADEWAITYDDPTPTEDSRRKQIGVNSKGHPKYDSRFPKTYRGFEASGTVACPRCGESLDFTLTGEDTASAFESMV